MNLDPIQAQAISTALANPLSIITGGPGTGKTTVCQELLRQAAVPMDQVALAAPTGKAARRLQEQTHYPAKTIHRLLEYSPFTEGFTRDRNNPLDCHLLVVDESSMVDVELAAALLEAVAPPRSGRPGPCWWRGCRVVLVGDADQLPSVGPGNVLRDLIASGTVPTTRLERIYRQGEGSLICQNAAAVLAGRLPDFPEEAADMFWIDCPEAENIPQVVEELLRDRLLANHGIHPSDAQVLSPQRSTAAGVEALNAHLQSAINPPAQLKSEAQGFRQGDRVMHIRNNYKLERMNGEVGEIRHIIVPGGPVITVDFGDGFTDYQGADVADLRLCYATTIHKAQGSEYPAVIAIVHSSMSYMLSRTLLYTAITRGKRAVYLVGNKVGLRRAVKNNKTVARNTALKELLL
jgi:exodeoxyribonuclease V alpha subunit